MATKTGKDLNIEGVIDNNYLTEYFVAKAATTPDWLYLGDGIESAEPKVEDKKNSKAYYNTAGQERTSITGATKSYDFSGDRSIGNPAQDLIAQIQDETGTGRYLTLRVNQYSLNEDGTLALVESEQGVATWSDITALGGNANDAKSFKATATYNAKPKKLRQDNPTELAKVLEDTPSVNAVLLSTTAAVKGDGGSTPS